jgi:hypothetical protein
VRRSATAYTSDSNVYAFVAGPRVSGGEGAVRSFGQLLFGVVGSTKRTTIVTRGRVTELGSLDGGYGGGAFAIQPGVGVDMDVASRLSVRVGANYRLLVSILGQRAGATQVFAGMVVHGRR